MVRQEKKRTSYNGRDTTLYDISMKAASTSHEIAELYRRLERLHRLAWWLNSAAKLPGIRTRIGLDTLLGLVPGGGDLVAAGLSLYIVWEGHRLGVDRATVLKMLVNVGVECAVGIVPVLGDIFDTVFKADLRNIALMEQAIQRRAPRRTTYPE